MGRLIDADAFLQNLINCDIGRKSLEKVIEAVKKQPTAYDPEKVVEQLENERKFWENAYNRNLGKEKARSYEHAIEIVKGGGADG